ncbi:MAG TPA: serine/threonine-protein kinase [Polyangiaceae bacterium LLY-WYZ-14_1]|nr:serine/threonine-protein kinase [Polyangiaceae bacterium LLY-WYZ-14_1]
MSRTSPRSTALERVRQPADALLESDRSTTRFFSLLMIWSAPLSVLLMELLGGDPWRRRLAQGATVAFVVLCGAQLYASRRGLRPHPRFDLFFGVASAGLFLFLLPFFGVLSAIVIIIPLGLMILIHSESLPAAVATYVTVAAGQVGLTLGIVLGGLEDRALSPIAEQPVNPLVLLLFQQLAFLLAFLVARASRQFTRSNLEALAVAVRKLAQREAELFEAYDELARASTRVGGPLTGARLGRWTLGDLIGRGGAGEVYEAVAADDATVAAIKVLSRSTIEDPDLVERFLREARLLGEIDSPHVVRLLELPTGGVGLPHLVLERLQGETLAELLRRRGRLSLPEVVVLSEEIASGLQAAHRLGVIHRDLKPSNVFLDQRAGVPCWKILDFGVSKMPDFAPTQGNFILGTPAYAAPEQVRGGRLDGRVDVHALAAVCYRALTGQAPFASPNPEQTLELVRDRMPAPPTGLRPDLPRAVDDVLRWGLMKRPRDRAPSPTAFAEALARAAAPAYSIRALGSSGAQPTSNSAASSASS